MTKKNASGEQIAANRGTRIGRPTNIKPIRVLLTGFLPFARLKSNPSDKAVRFFSQKGLASNAGYPIVIDKRILKVDKLARRRLAQDELVDYDIILHIGVGRQISAIQLEKIAYNKVNVDLRDSAGRSLRNRPIREKGPWILQSTLPFKDIEKEYLDQKVPFIYSRYAGNHICNYILYSSLMRTHKKRPKKLVGFIHIADFKLLSMKESQRAIRLLLEVCIAKVEKQRARRENEQPLRRIIKNLTIKLAERLNATPI